MHFHVSTIPRSVYAYVRENHKDPVYKHPAHTDVATSYGPCRQCLQFFTPGVDRRILFTYDAFLGLDDIRQPGPVFIHEQDCQPYADADFPQHLTDHALTFEAYAKGKKLISSETTPVGTEQLPVAGFFARPDVDYIIVRDRDAGCFDCAIVRD